MMMTDLADGESTEMKGSGKKPYVLKNTGGVYSCSCPAWRNQSNSIDLRTCKHIIKLRGEDKERERLGDAFPEKGKKKVSKSAKSAATKKKQAAAAARKPDLLLAHTWTGEDPTGWWMSEKLDGVRAYWDGENFISRNGNIFHAPDWFKKGLGGDALDGELFVGRGQFQKTVSIVRRQDGKGWEDVQYIVFDAPQTLVMETDGDPASFEDRLVFLKSMSKLRAFPDHVKVLLQEQCEGEEHLMDKLAEVEEGGGEGLMLREASSVYEGGRSTTLLKVKTFHDAEARIVGYNPGTGRHKGRLGSYQCELLDDGTDFDCGGGLTDKHRENPLPVGTVITFKYFELTDEGKPRFNSFLRVKEDE